MRRFAHSTILALLVLLVGVQASSALAKKGKPADDTQSASSASNTDTAKAELRATLALANVKLSRLALTEDSSLSDAKDTLSPIYDRQESATKSALDKLRSAAGDKAKIASAVAAIDAADDESARYLKANPVPADKITRRVTLMNAEIGQITKSPDAYLATLEKVGVTGDAFAKAKSLVKDAAPKKSPTTDAAKSNPDSTDAAMTARAQIHQLMSPRQLKALDAQLAAH